MANRVPNQIARSEQPQNSSSAKKAELSVCQVDYSLNLISIRSKRRANVNVLNCLECVSRSISAYSPAASNEKRKYIFQVVAQLMDSESKTRRERASCLIILSIKPNHQTSSSYGNKDSIRVGEFFALVLDFYSKHCSKSKNPEFMLQKYQYK